MNNLQFVYVLCFPVRDHDSDENGYLDGLELLHAILEGLDAKFEFLEDLEDEDLAERKAHMLKTKAWCKFSG